MSLTCDPRAPVNVPKEILDGLPDDPDIQELTRQRNEVRKQYRRICKAPDEIRRQCEELYRQIDSLQKQRERDLKIEYRRRYFERIRREELERQSKKDETGKYVKPTIYHQLPERTLLQEVLCDHSKNLSMNDIVSRHVRAIDLMVAFSR